MKNGAKEKNVLLKSIVIASVVIVVLVFIVLAIYQIIFNEKRSNIIKDGQMTAFQSAENCNIYLSNSINAVKISAYTIDGMLETSTNDEILDYLVGQMNAITGTIFENTTGLYGYINGEYLVS